MTGDAVTAYGMHEMPEAAHHPAPPDVPQVARTSCSGGGLRGAAFLVVVLSFVCALLSGCGSDREESGGPPDTGAVPHSTSEPVSRPPRPSAGCGSAPSVGPTDDPTGDVAREVQVDGRQRRYRLGVPDSYDPDEPVGMVLHLHGALSGADQHSVYTQMAAQATDRGFLVVTPDAVDGHWDLGVEGPDDRFFTALLDDLEAAFCIDLDSVHAAGISLGAWKATITACAHPDRFASLVLVAEQVPVDGCAMPVLAFHGTADAVVPFGEGADEGVVVEGANSVLPGVEANMPGWAANGGCSSEKDVRRVEPDIEHWSYRGCPDGIDVELYVIEGGGHTWPGAPIDVPHLGATTKTIDATDLAIDWFEAHPLR